MGVRGPGRLVRRLRGPLRPGRAPPPGAPRPARLRRLGPPGGRPGGQPGGGGRLLFPRRPGHPVGGRDGRVERHLAPAARRGSPAGRAPGRSRPGRGRAGRAGRGDLELPAARVPGRLRAVPGRGRVHPPAAGRWPLSWCVRDEHASSPGIPARPAGLPSRWSGRADRPSSQSSGLLPTVGREDRSGAGQDSRTTGPGRTLRAGEAGTVRDSGTIWYRGAGYQLGRGEHGYAIWPAGGPPGQPLEQWPETPAGWSAAWSRFNAVEAPGTIVHLGPPADPVPAPPAGPVPAPPAGPVSAPPAGPVSGPPAYQVSGPPAAPGSWRPAAGPVPPGARLLPARGRLLPRPGPVPPGRPGQVSVRPGRSPRPSPWWPASRSGWPGSSPPTCPGPASPSSRPSWCRT